MKHHIFLALDGESTDHRYHSRVEIFLRSLFQHTYTFLESQTIACVLLMLMTAIALVWASTPALEHYYQQLLSMKIGIHISTFIIEKDVKSWVNNFLLTLFFFFLGLEIKREVLVGGLTDHKCLLFVFCAALGGMLVPGLMFWLCNLHSVYAHAWGIPLSTDTAFTLGILACFRSKLPDGAFAFMAGLAILDDILALSVIAVFYSQHIHVLYLAFVFALICFSIILNYCGVRHPIIYLFVGMIAWYFMDLSGVHGTIAGILIAFTVPARPKKGPCYAVNHMQELICDFETCKIAKPLVFEDQQQHQILEEIQTTAKCSTTPLQHWRSFLEMPVAFVVLPLFAFCNAGIAVNSHLLMDVFRHWLSLSIILSLVLGKFLGVTLFSKLSIWLRLGKLPEQTNFKHIMVLSVISGIGFTMSLFISMLSFGDGSQALALAKASVIVASFISAVGGVVLLSKMKSRTGGFL